MYCILPIVFKIGKIQYIIRPHCVWAGYTTWDCDVIFVVRYVVANSIWSCLLISASEVHWRLQMTVARRSSRFNRMHGALDALHMLLNNAFMTAVRKWLKRDNGHLITLQNWMPWKTSYLVSKAWSYFEISIQSSEAQNSFWIKSRTREDMRQFSTGPINKAVPSFKNSLTKVREGWWNTFWVFFFTQKSNNIYDVCTVLNSWDNFWECLNCKVAMTKSNEILSIR